MAKKNPSTRWFFKDWHSDIGLHLCSLAARGAWIELLGLCAENGGYLLFNGKAPSDAILARYVGATPAIMRRLLRELEHYGVFSRTDQGIIFSRRMIREAEREWQPPSESENWWPWYNSYLESDAWRTLRSKIIDRCDGVCEHCHDARVAQVHHLTYEHVGNERLDELLGVCIGCHDHLHDSKKAEAH